jgi:sialic acid synthase SpsE
MREVEIGGLKIGAGQPVRVIGELGICHRGDVELAKKLATAVADAGVDYIKFEVYQLDTALTEPYRGSANITFGTACHGVIEENLFDAFKSGHLSFEDLADLIAHIKSLGIPFFATACSKEEVDFLKDQGACAVKLSSGEIDHIPLIRYVAEIGMPMFIDSATTYMWEVVRAVEEYEIEGGENVVVMQNPAGYPAPPELVDLDRIPALQAALGIPIGYTCHSPGRSAIMAALGKGARVIEKPVSPDNQLPYIEYAFSENMEDFASFVKEVDFVSRANGQGRRLWDREEMKEHRLHRHGIVAAQDLPGGVILKESDLRIARPGYGLRPELIDDICGLELNRDIKSGEVIDWGDLRRHREEGE